MSDVLASMPWPARQRLARRILAGLPVTLPTSVRPVARPARDDSHAEQARVLLAGMVRTPPGVAASRRAVLADALAYRRVS